MAPSKSTSKPKTPRSGSLKCAPATLRSTSGAGFEFEDLISAWQLVKALSGEQATDIGVVTKVQAQVSTLGWRIDDLLLTAQPTTASRRLAISAKGNIQVNAAGLPTDFVTRAWEQWRDPHGPFNRSTDGLALVTLDTHKEFNPTWREVKSACSGTDTSLSMSRIRSNKKQSRVFDSVQKPGAATDEETIELIRRLHVLPTDLQDAHSENKAQAIAQCRRLLASGRDNEAQALWKELINVAKDVRLRKGTITVPGMLSLLRGQFGLRHHPDFESDWETLTNITADHKARIETELPSGYALPRTAEKELLQEAVADNPVTVVFGESGTGKSALVKSVLDGAYPSWNQVWFGPEDLKTALSAARRNTLPLTHELSLVLNATVKPQNVLVIDSAERIEAGEFVVIRQLLQTNLLRDGEETGGGMGLSAAVGLYMEAQYRSIVFGRWPPVLRFLIAQRERLAGLVSSALAKVIETWLTKTPLTLSNGNPMPFRLEMAEMALAMARTVQVEKGHGVMYLAREPLLRTRNRDAASPQPARLSHWAALGSPRTLKRRSTRSKSCALV